MKRDSKTILKESLDRCEAAYQELLGELNYIASELGDRVGERNIKDILDSIEEAIETAEELRSDSK